MSTSLKRSEIPTPIGEPIRYIKLWTVAGTPAALAQLKGPLIVKRSRAVPHVKPVEGDLIRAKEARLLVGGRGMLDKLERCGWIHPVSRAHRCTLYNRKDVLACVARLGWGEVPQTKEKPSRSKI